MDILKEIEIQIMSIKRIDSSKYLDSILTHMHRAEYYYLAGKNDSDYFNDVIYRSNQAFEGALKESYKLLAGKPNEEVIKKSPNEIETYFIKENIFRERVLQLFKNYRQEWRNKSTHDFKLFFDESEAFLALTSVSSFVHLLLKQIQEKVAENTQEKILRDEAAKLINLRPKTTDGAKPIEKLVSLLREFSQYNEKRLKDNLGISESEIIGHLYAYLDFIDENVHATREPSFKMGVAVYRPDFLIMVDKEKILLEVKRDKTEKNYSRKSNLNQMQTYLLASGLSKGIIFNANFRKPVKQIKVENIMLRANDVELEIAVISAF